MAIFYAIIYASVLALVNVSVGYFTESWLKDVDEPEKIAARMIAIMWFVTGALTPLFGTIVDYFGHRSAIVQYANNSRVYYQHYFVLYLMDL